MESVELAIRKLIVEVLEGDQDRLPSQVTENTDARIDAAARKNPAFDTERYATLEGRLEYCDLRDLQGIIMNKTLWPNFEGIFSPKELLTARFGQFAELRNGIRHSRTVPDVMRKDGEAAILWFKQVISRKR